MSAVTARRCVAKDNAHGRLCFMSVPADRLRPFCDFHASDDDEETVDWTWALCPDCLGANDGCGACAFQKRVRVSR